MLPFLGISLSFAEKIAHRCATAALSRIIAALFIAMLLLTNKLKMGCENSFRAPFFVLRLLFVSHYVIINKIY